MNTSKNKNPLADVSDIRFTVGEVSAVMTRFGDFFIIYSDLGSVNVEKGDTVVQGQKLGDLFCVDNNCEIILILSDTNSREKDPYPWFRKENISHRANREKE